MLKDLYSVERAAISQADLNRILGEHGRYVAKQGGVRAVLRSAKLNGMAMANRNLSEADLSGASLVGANLYGTNLTRASLYCADLRDCDLRNANLERADLRGVSFRGANLSYAVMNYADMRAASMMYVGDKVEIQGNAHDEAPFGAVDFSNCSLCNASFGNAKLGNANFSDALLHGAIFRGAKLANACFRGAILTGVNLAELDVPRESLKDCLTSSTPAAIARAKDLLELTKAHHEWVNSGGKKGKAAILDGEDLRPLAENLAGLCLVGLSARNVIATSVNFSGCQLQAARFDDADLRGANFADVDLSGASFDRAKLAHANFRNARIQNLVLRSGEIMCARAENANALPDQFRNAHVEESAFISGLCAQRPAPPFAAPAQLG